MPIQSTNQKSKIQNIQKKQALTTAQTTLQNLQNTMTGATVDDQIAQIKAAATTIEQQAQQAVRNNYIDANTMNAKIKTIQGIMLGQFIQNQLNQSQINLNQQQITESINRIQQNWENIGINKQNANTNERHLKLQQLVKDIPDSEGKIIDGVTKLLPVLLMML